MIKKVLFFSLFFSFSAFAATSTEYSLAEKRLMATEWDGAPAFIQFLEMNKQDVCVILRNSESKFSKVRSIVTRILTVAEKSKCPLKIELAKKYINSHEPSHQAAAIRIVASLSKTERQPFNSTVEKLRKSAAMNATIQGAINEYPKN